MKYLLNLTMLFAAFTLNSCKQSMTAPISAESNQTSLTTESGLLSYYSFNGNAKDSITGFEGIVHGAALVPDKHGIKDGAYCFKDCNKYICLPHGIVADSLAVYAIYIRFKADTGTLLYSGDINTSGSSLELVNRGVIYKWNFHGFLSSVKTNPGLISGDAWNDLVISVQNQFADVYLNGVHVTSQMSYGPLQGQQLDPNVPHFGIAKFLPVGADLLGASSKNGKYDSFLNGAIDELRFYKRFLSPVEVATLYKE